MTKTIEEIIDFAMSQYLSDYETDSFARWLKFDAEQSDVDWRDAIGVSVWQPFEDCDEETVFEHIDNMVYSLLRFLGMESAKYEHYKTQIEDGR